jgi:hypothetical protein
MRFDGRGRESVVGGAVERVEKVARAKKVARSASAWAMRLERLNAPTK